MEGNIQNASQSCCSFALHVHHPKPSIPSLHNPVHKSLEDFFFQFFPLSNCAMHMSLRTGNVFRSWTWVYRRVFCF